MNADRRREGCGNELGFTMIEVLICMGIFAVGFLAMAGLQISSMRGNASARNSTEASMWADNCVEDLLTKDYDHPDLETGRHSDTRGGFDVVWNVVEKDLDSNGQFDLKEVDLTLRAPFNGRDKNIRLFFVVPSDVDL